MLHIVQNLGFRRCSPKQQWWNSYTVEIRTDCSICQCKGPLKGPENLMSTHTLSPALWHFLSSMRLHTRKKTSTSSSLLLCEQNGLSLLFLVTSGQNVKSSPTDCQQNKVFSKWEWTGASIFRWPMFQLLFLSPASVWYDDLWPVRFLLNFRKGQRA